MDVVIVAAKRSPVGSFTGALSSLSAVEIGTQVCRDLLTSCEIDATDVDELISGQVLTAGCGQNPARQTALNCGMRAESTALTINQLCGSGLKTVMLGAQAIASGEASIVIAGGQESMTNAPHSLPNSRSGKRMGDMSMSDTMLLDGLTDAFEGYHMGITAENLVSAFPQLDLGREAQDAMAAASHQKATQAQAAGWFDEEITPITITPRRGDPITITKDEGIKPETSTTSLAKLRPAFVRDGGSVTAGNASSINDGAAYVLLMSSEEAARRELTVLATIRSYATAGVEPSIMGSGPIPATKKALSKAGLDINDIDLVEANEAFGVQALCVQGALGIASDKLNIGGGAIALGHPIGASGCRVLVTLLHHMQRTNAELGLATLCVGGGQGVSMIVER